MSVMLVMQLPVGADRQMIRQNLATDEDEAIFAEIAVGRAIVDIFDQIAVVGGGLRQKGREFGRIFDLFKIIAAMRPDRPGQNGG